MAIYFSHWTTDRFHRSGIREPHCFNASLTAMPETLWPMNPTHRQSWETGSADIKWDVFKPRCSRRCPQLRLNTFLCICSSSLCAKPEPIPTWLLPRNILGGPFYSTMVFFHGGLYIKKRNHSLCLLSLRGSYKDRVLVKYWKDCCFAALTGKDVATSVEVFWPDGRSVARPLEPSDMNKVMEIHYPENEEEVTPALEIEVNTVTCS